MKWISIKQKFPDKEGRYLVFCNEWKNKIQVLKFSPWTGDHPMKFWTQTGISTEKITHWMPLPEKPKS